MGGVPLVTVIVPTRDRSAMIAECVRSLLALDYPELQILIVDQSSTDETVRAVEAIAREDLRLQVLRTPSNGASIARNLGACASTAEIVAYTDDDCIVDPQWVQNLVREFEDPRVALVHGRVLAAPDERRTGTELAYKPVEGRFEYAGRVPPWYVGHGANMAIRRAALLEVGGFDPLLGAGGHFGACEDPDMTYRLLLAGWRGVYTGHALVYHRQWRSWRERQRTERHYGVGAGALFAKHVRMGDLYGLRLLATWTWELGVRRVGAGLLKWRSFQPMYLGYCQLVYPWVGITGSLRQKIDHRRHVYVAGDAHPLR
jgi:cellulose synthase/poly-beta-1,6-N-acetylglucosamine synthase-like glycosyltransferase